MIVPKSLQKNALLPESMQQYLSIRQRAQNLSNDIFRRYTSLIIPNAARDLGFVNGRVITVDETTEDLNLLMSYALFYYTIKGKTLLQMYKEEAGAELDEVDIRILDAKISSKVGFFKVISRQPQTYTLTLRPLGQKDVSDIMVTDIGFSASAVIGLVIYLRIIEIDDLAMTAGFTFAFPEKHETYILRNYQSVGRTFNVNNKDCQEFLGVRKLSQSHGNTVRTRVNWQE